MELDGRASGLLRVATESAGWAGGCFTCIDSACVRTRLAAAHARCASTASCRSCASAAICCCSRAPTSRAGAAATCRSRRVATTRRPQLGQLHAAPVRRLRRPLAARRVEHLLLQRRRAPRPPRRCLPCTSPPTLPPGRHRGALSRVASRRHQRNDRGRCHLHPGRMADRHRHRRRYRHRLTQAEGHRTGGGKVRYRVSGTWQG